MKLVYSAIASLDGFVEDQTGAFDWSAPDEEVLTFVNDLERPIGTYLYRRRMYETMVYWETTNRHPDPSPAVVQHERDTLDRTQPVEHDEQGCFHGIRHQCFLLGTGCVIHVRPLIGPEHAGRAITS